MTNDSEDTNPQKGPANAGGALNIKSIPITGIVVGDDFRKLDTKTVNDLGASFREFGLMHPPTVCSERVPGFGPAKYRFRLVAGRHRLEAAKSLGWESIDVVVVEVGKKENRRRQITENLHRKPLTLQERTKQTQEWVEKCAEEGGKVSHPQPHNKGISRAAKELKKSKKAVRLDLEMLTITDDAWKKLEEVGLEGNQSVALEVAKMKPNKQIAGIQAIVEQRAERQKAKALNKMAAERPKMRKAASSKADTKTEEQWDNTSLDKLVSAWGNSLVLREAWAKATAEDRKRFVDEVLFADDDGG